MSKLVANYDYTDAELLALWREAYAQLSLGGQSYSIAGRTLTRANLSEIRQQIDWLEARIDNATAGPIAFSSVRRVRPEPILSDD